VLFSQKVLKTPSSDGFPPRKFVGFLVPFWGLLPALMFRVWAKYKTGLPGNSPPLTGGFEHPELFVLRAQSKNQ